MITQKVYFNLFTVSICISMYKKNLCNLKALDDQQPQLEDFLTQMGEGNTERELANSSKPQ